MLKERLASKILLKWYQPEAMYVTTYHPIFGKDEKVVGGVGRDFVNPASHGAFNEPAYMDAVRHLDDVTTTMTLTVKAAHMRGHPWALPGYKIVWAMEESARQNYHRQTERTTHLQLIAYQSVSFRQLIACGDTVEFVSTLARSSESGIVEADMETIAGEKVAAIIKGARFREVPGGPDRNTTLLNRLMEGAAQTVVLLADEGAENANPIFQGTGQANFSNFPRTDEEVLYQVSNLRRSGIIFAADVIISVKDAESERRIGNIARLTGSIMPKRKS